MEKDPKDINPEYQEIRTEEVTYRERNKLILPLVVTGLVLFLLIMYFALSGDSHYDRGLQYLKQDQYTEALVEFQKVDTDEKDFRMAQSKINYINGLLAYKDGVHPQAKVYLTKVEPSDEYYRESRLMIDKIDLASRQGNLESLNEQLKQDKDTVIIKEKVIETLPPDKVGEAETPDEDLVTSRKYVSSLQNLSSKFEALYQSAKNSSIESKKVFINEMDSLYSEFKKSGYSSGKNAAVSELKQVADSWMQKRISYINRLIADNSVNETNSSLALKEEGDKDYKLLQTMIRNNQF